jgi:hypothetical protein
MGDGIRYPVLFCKQGEPPKAGSLSVNTGAIVLIGGARESTQLRLQPHLITGLRTSRSPAERLNGYPVLVIEQSQQDSPLLIAPLGAGLLSELAHLLYTLTDEAANSDRVTVVLPLKTGRRDRARDLIRHGPPFPAETLIGIRHAVYLDQDSVLFVFDGPDAHSALRRLLSRPSLWRASLRWRDLSSAPPYIAERGTTTRASAELLYISPPEDA